MPPRGRGCSCGPPRVGPPRGRPNRGPSRPRDPPGSPGGGGAAGSGRGPSRRGGRARRQPAADHRPGRRHGGRRGHRRDGSERLRTRRRSHGRGCARSGREAGATPRAAALEHRTATTGAHADTETVLLLALPVVGLEGPLHAGLVRSDGGPSGASPRRMAVTWAPGAGRSGILGRATGDRQRGTAQPPGPWSDRHPQPGPGARYQIPGLGTTPESQNRRGFSTSTHRWRGPGPAATFALPRREQRPRPGGLPRTDPSGFRTTADRRRGSARTLAPPHVWTGLWTRSRS